MSSDRPVGLQVDWGLTPAVAHHCSLSDGPNAIQIRQLTSLASNCRDLERAGATAVTAGRFTWSNIDFSLSSSF